MLGGFLAEILSFQAYLCVCVCVRARVRARLHVAVKASRKVVKIFGDLGILERETRIK
jgi:hypothetical protein